LPSVEERPFFHEAIAARIAVNRDELAAGDLIWV
jgi:hypothetical protein